MHSSNLSFLLWFWLLLTDHKFHHHDFVICYIQERWQNEHDHTYWGRKINTLFQVHIFIFFTNFSYCAMYIPDNKNTYSIYYAKWSKHLKEKFQIIFHSLWLK